MAPSSTQILPPSTIPAASVFLLLLAIVASGLKYGGAAAETAITLENKCAYRVWPGITAAAEQAVLAGGGMELGTGERVTMEAPKGWSGRVWARTGCVFDESTGRGYCDTGDCGGVLKCGGSGGTPPVTLAEFTLASHEEEGEKDFYDVSLVDGFNMAVVVAAEGGGEEACASAGCLGGTMDLDLLGADCPTPLAQTDASGLRIVACRSACDAFADPAFCCTGAFSSPDTCAPSTYSRLFKSACPAAYSYAYDDPTSTFTCAGPSRSYTITFCPS